MKKTLNVTIAALILLSGLMVLPGIMNNRGYASLSSNIPSNSPITTPEVFLSPSPMPSKLTPSLQQQSWQAAIKSNEVYGFEFCRRSRIY